MQGAQTISPDALLYPPERATAPAGKEAPAGALSIAVFDPIRSI